MNYREATEYLFTQLPSFERSGKTGYKPGLYTSTELSRIFGNPHKQLRCIHIAGTNGKGSTAHMLAAILQSAGYKTGLYTSPHLVDMRERIRIDGKEITEAAVVDFVQRWKVLSQDESNGIHPTFFELTTIMAFEWFVENDVDIAVIETGLGGRLDTTNIITPVVSVITHISLDHTDLLGDNLSDIAREKAGIIKPNTPVVVGHGNDDEALAVIAAVAKEQNSKVIVAERCDNPSFEHRLPGEWQLDNISTVRHVVDELRLLGWNISEAALTDGIEHVESLTGLRGRWTVISDKPLTVYDTGHNPGAWARLVPAIMEVKGMRHIVLGFVADKDIDSILKLLPKRDCIYYLCAPSTKRALPAQELARRALSYGLKADCYLSVDKAFEAAKTTASAADLIFVGGSNYLVGEFLQAYPYLRGK